MAVTEARAATICGCGAAIKAQVASTATIAERIKASIYGKDRE
jgi:hypothetical protein